MNLSILLTGGKETNKDSLSSGERSGKSSNLKSERAHCPLRIVVFGSMVTESVADVGYKFFGTRHQRG